MEPLPNYPNSSNNTNKGDLSLKNPLRKKPGRKPNPSSHALRRAQNRVAQRVFRERKYQHVVDLEESINVLREECNQLMKENKALYSGIGALGNEGRHLKGLMMSLQLVCLMNNTQVPDHAPYLDDEYLRNSVLHSQESPEMVFSYTKARDLHKLQQDNANSNEEEKPKSPSTTMSMSKTDGQYVSTGMLLVDKDGVRNVIGNRVTAATLPSSFGQPTMQQVQPFQNQQRPQNIVSTTSSFMETDDSSDNNDNYNDNGVDHSIKQKNHHKNGDEDFQSASFSTKPIALTEGTLPSFDLVKFQTMRLQLQLQLVCNKSNRKPFKLDPTSLQLKIPHDLRIDLIPISAMRDRMILFQDNYDLDDCIRCLLDGMVYLQDCGDPSKATSWEFPVEFYEKYWFLIHDYSAKEIKKRWPDLNKDTLKNILFQISIADNEFSFSNKTNHCTDPFPENKIIPSSPLISMDESSVQSDKQQQNHYPASLSSEESINDCLSLQENEDPLPLEIANNTISDVVNLVRDVNKSIIIPAESDDYGIPWRTELLTSNYNYIV